MADIDRGQCATESCHTHMDIVIWWSGYYRRFVGSGSKSYRDNG